MKNIYCWLCHYEVIWLFYTNMCRTVLTVESRMRFVIVCKHEVMRGEVGGGLSLFVGSLCRAVIAWVDTC